MNASWYGPGFEGATTANGEVFDPSGFTAAHKTLPFGTTLEVCYEGCVNVRINDRGPFIAGRDLDLAQGAADAIGLTAVGHAAVNVTYTDGSAPAGPSGEAEPSGETTPQPTEQPQTQPEQPQAQPTAQPEAPVAEPQAPANEVSQADTAADGQYAVEDQYEGEDGSAADNQYEDEGGSAANDQYDPEDSADFSAADSQYSPPAETQSSPVAEAAPEPLAPPEPAAVETAPLELATPGSTVERRIVLALAAPPENYTGALPEASPEDPPAEAASVAQEEAPSEEAPLSEGVPNKESEPESSPEEPKSGSVAAVAGLTVLPDTGGLPVAPLAGAALVAMSLMLVGVRAFRR
jgi:rare lipoprotein A